MIATSSGAAVASSNQSPGSFAMRSLKPVAYGPGLISATSTPNGASSLRSTPPIACMACLVIEYGPDPAPARTPAIDDTSRIRPDRLRRIACATRWATASAPNTLTSNTRRTRSSGMTLSGPVWPSAGVADVHVEVPSVDDRQVVGVGDVELDDGQLGMRRPAARLPARRSRRWRSPCGRGRRARPPRRGRSHSRRR